MFPVSPMTDDTLMIRPVPRSIMWSSAAWAMKKAPDKLTAITFCQSSSDILATVRSIVIPALFTRMSRRPCWSMTSRTTRRQSSASPMLPSCNVQRCWGYSAARAAWNFSAPSCCCQWPAATDAPSLASSWQMAAPMPVVPPVTRATRPLTMPTLSCCGDRVTVIVSSFLPYACARAVLTMWLISSALSANLLRALASGRRRGQPRIHAAGTGRVSRGHGHSRGRLPAELLDLLELSLGQAARHIVLGDFHALHVVPDVLDDLRVGQGGDVPDVSEVGDGRDHPAHDLSRPGLGHVRDDPDVLRPCDLADLGLNGLADLALQLAARLETRLERDIYLHHTAPDVIDHRDGGGFGDLGDGQRGGLDLLGAEPVASDVDHIIDPAEYPEVAVGGLERPVVGEVRPVVPVFAIGVLVVLAVVGVQEPIGIAPDRLEDARPGVADADVARLASRNLVGVLVVDDRVDAQHARPAAARLHRLQAGQRAAEKPAVFGLPPGVGDSCLALADLGVIPPPYLGLDRLAHCRHALEVVVVLLRLFRRDLAQHPDRRGRDVEDVHAEVFGDPPRPPAVGVVGHPLVDHRGGAQRQRAVDDVGVAGDPADVGQAPVHVVWVDVLVILGRAGDVGQVPAGAVLAALWAAGGAAGVHQEQWRLGRHRQRLDGPAPVLGENLIDEEVPAIAHRGRRGVLASVAPPDQHLVDLLALLGRLREGLVGLDLVIA